MKKNIGISLLILNVSHKTHFGINIRFGIMLYFLAEVQLSNGRL